MSTTTSPNFGPSPEIFSGLMASVYSQAGEAAMVGSFVAGSKSGRSAMLNRLKFQPLPAELIEAALEVQDDEVLWDLAQREDLPPEALEVLIARKSPLVHRRLAQSPQMSNEDLMRLLPGDEFVRQRVFMHPNASRELRRQIVTARHSSGVPMPRASALEEELLKPEYALWLLDSDTRQDRMQALESLPELPASHQWRFALRVADGAISLSVALSQRGWVAPLESALREALAALTSGGEAHALEVLRGNLESLGAPPLYAEDEARLLPDESEAEALAPPNKLDWDGLERLLRSGMMTVAAVRYLLQRDDRTAGFTTAALAFHGDSPGVLGLCDLGDLQAASTMSGFALAERTRLVKLVVTTPTLPYKLLDMVGHLPIRDVLAQIQAAEDELAEFQLGRLSAELSDLLGDSLESWRAFESARSSGRNVTFSEALTAARVES